MHMLRVVKRGLLPVLMTLAILTIRDLKELEHLQTGQLETEHLIITHQGREQHPLLSYAIKVIGATLHPQRVSPIIIMEAY
jgi:hypothetical protein